MDSSIQIDSSASPQPKQASEQNNSRKTWLVTAIAILLLAIGIFAVTLVGASRFISGSVETKKDIETVRTDILSSDFVSAKQVTISSIEHLRVAQSGLKFLFVLRPLPWVGKQIEATDVLLSAGIESMEATDSMIDIAIDVKSAIDEAQNVLESFEVGNSFSLETLPDDVRIELIKTLHQSSDELIEVQTKLKLAQDNLNAFYDLQNIHPAFLEVAKPMQEMLSELLAGIDILITLAQTIDELAGIDGTKQWLVLFLNNTEIRPGGGFIGVYGLVQITNGEIDDIFTSDSYSVDKLVEGTDYHVNAPAPITEYLGVDGWYFRDANWSPDFVESSKTAIQLLRQEISYSGNPVPEIAGVIGITPTVVEQILKIIGPIEERDITFTSENVTEELEYYVEYGYSDIGLTWEDRKDIVGELATGVLNAFVRTPFEDWSAIIDMINSAITGKQLALYSASDEVQQVFEDRGWAGNIGKQTDDVLFLVDANMGALKTDHAIDRNVSYAITPQGDNLYATVDIVYSHTGEIDWRTSRYQNYARIFAPLGSALMATSLADSNIALTDIDVVDELGMTSFGTYIIIEPGKEKKLSFVYKLPESVKQAVKDNIYQLSVLKQIGSENYPLTINLEFDTKVRLADPAEESEFYGDSVYTIQTTLETDKLFTVQF